MNQICSFGFDQKPHNAYRLEPKLLSQQTRVANERGFSHSEALG